MRPDNNRFLPYRFFPKGKEEQGGGNSKKERGEEVVIAVKNATQCGI